MGELKETVNISLVLVTGDRKAGSNFLGEGWASLFYSDFKNVSIRERKIQDALSSEEISR